MSSRSDPIEWTPEVVLSLRQLWDEGHSTAEIGRRLGVSKNAVVGKAHRLDLPSRPSPIRREGGSTPRAPRRPPVPQLADIVPLTTAVVVPVRLLSETCSFPQRTTPARANPVAQDRARFAPCSPGAIGNNPCCWPIGEPGGRDFRFCDSSALVGKPYCGEHAQLAYRRVRRRDDDDGMAARNEQRFQGTN
jgi:GcrA cell cycle regulator